MSSGNQVVQVARAVANGDGDWADVPRCVREAIVLALAGPDAPPALAMRGPRSEAHCCAPFPATEAAVTETALECGVRTFADAALLRAEAVRSFAQFHNDVEALRVALRHRHRALWRTALQLHPEIVGAVRRAARLSPGDEIPDGVPIPPADAQRIARLEERVAELEECVEAARGASLRLAASFLADEEKRAMGLDPEDLRPEDVEPVPRKFLTRDDGWLTDGTNLFDDPTLSEIRQRYMNRIATINEEKYCGVVEKVLANRQSRSNSGTRSEHRKKVIPRSTIE